MKNLSSGWPAAGSPSPWFLVACIPKGRAASRGEGRTATAKPAAGLGRIAVQEILQPTPQAKRRPTQEQAIQFHLNCEPSHSCLMIPGRIEFRTRFAPRLDIAAGDRPCLLACISFLASDRNPGSLIVVIWG